MEYNIVTINEREYYLSDNIFKEALVYTKGSRNARELIKKKKISKDKYIFAALKDNKWKTTDGSSRKVDKILFTKEFVDNDIEEIKNANSYDMVPDKITLSKEEMFKDNDGNTINVQVVGERDHEKCYFRVKDIMKEFNMINLENAITDKKAKFELNIEYKYFYCRIKRKNNNKVMIKKEMYLTLAGFRKLIECSRINLDVKSKNNIHKWLNQFIENNNDYNINLSNKKFYNTGYVYCITSPLLNAVKIGFWKSKIGSLKSRYITPYGNNLILFYVKMKNPEKIEKLCHTEFRKNKITNGLFDKNNFNEYCNFLEKNKIV